MLVHDVMTPHAEWIAPSLTVAEAARKMRDHKVGGLPVGENDRLVGMITDRDIVCRAIANGADPKKAKVSDVMTKGVTWCFDDETVDDVMERMDAKHIHRIPVLSRQKRMIGILSLSDLAMRGPQNLQSRLSHLASRDSHAQAAAH